VLEKGRLNETYNIGGENEVSNIDLVKQLCAHMDARFPDHAPHVDLVEYVTDRPGHDMRYGIDATKITNELGWKAEENIETGIEKTVNWYLANEGWWRGILANKYSGERLGKKAS
jgi:dTDP-glucose 4,6-dehydratase